MGNGRLPLFGCFLFFFLSFSVHAQQHYFSYAKTCIKKYNPPRKDLVIIIDYTKSIFSERLFLLDMRSGTVLIKSRVSHAWKSGKLYPNHFSNTIHSKMSSSGNFLTGRLINSPRFGPAMLLEGLDKGVNDHARRREIIFHSDKRMKSKWSEGCFATPDEWNRKIINRTRNGVLVCVLRD